MKITIIWIGKTNEKYLTHGMDIFAKRLKHYCQYEVIEIKDVKKFANTQDLKVKEGQEILSKIDNEDFLVLLDEGGQQYTSVKFSKYLEEQQVRGTRKMTFVVGGAFGFSDEVYQRANYKFSLSKMTFSHQMIRLFFYEQLYRAFTILRNEKYHNE